MKTGYRVLALTFALALGTQYTSTIIGAAQAIPADATRKGVVKKVDDATLVLTPADAKKTEVTYALSSSTKRTGSLAVGEEVVISYHYEHGKVVVTAVSGRPSK